MGVYFVKSFIEISLKMQKRLKVGSPSAVCISCIGIPTYKLYYSKLLAGAATATKYTVKHGLSPFRKGYIPTVSPSSFITFAV